MGSQLYMTVKWACCVGEDRLVHDDLLLLIIPGKPLMCLYPVMYTGLCLSLFILYGKSRVICTLTILKLTWPSRTRQENTLFNISIIKRNMEFKLLQGQAKTGSNVSTWSCAAFTSTCSFNKVLAS